MCRWVEDREFQLFFGMFFVSMRAVRQEYLKSKLCCGIILLKTWMLAICEYMINITEL